MALNKSLMQTDSGKTNPMSYMTATKQINPNSAFFKNPQSRVDTYNKTQGVSEGVVGAPAVTTQPVTETTQTTTQPTYSAPAQPDYMSQAMEAYRQAMEAQRRQAEQAYQTALTNLQNARNQSANNLRQDSDEAKRQAYINYMLGKRDVDQQLSNAGLSGGATESVLANLFNTYGNNRNSIDNNYVKALAELDTKYNENVANLGANYGQDTTGITSNYYNTIANLQANYASDLAKALGKTNTSYGKVLSGNEAAANRKTAIAALQALDGSPESMKRAMALYGFDYDSDEGQRLLLEAGFVPEAFNGGLSNNSRNNGNNSYNGGSSGISYNNYSNPDHPANTENTINGNVKMGIQNAYTLGGDQGVLDYISNLSQRGYSDETIRQALAELGL